MMQVQYTMVTLRKRIGDCMMCGDSEFCFHIACGFIGPVGFFLGWGFLETWFVALIHPLRTVVICTIIGLLCGQISGRAWLIRDEGGIECGCHFFFSSSGRFTFLLSNLDT